MATNGAHELRPAAREAFVFWGVGALVVVLVVIVDVAAQVLLVTFAGLLCGTTLRGAAEWLARRARVGIRWSLTLCLVAITALFAIAMLWIVPHVAGQVGELKTKLAQAISELQGELATSELGRQLSLGSFRFGTWLGQHAGKAAGVVMSTLGGLGALLYMLFVAVYFALSPATYRRGVLALVPRARRERADQVLDELGATLRRWLWARLISMTVLGVASWIALWLLDIPLALTLGLFAGALLFVPYLGALVSAVPALLIALTISPMHAVYVALLYTAIHLVDGYVLTPPLLRRAVSTPALLVLASQLVFGELWGIAGFAFATPLVAALMIVIRMLYVEDVLGDRGIQP